MPAPIRESVEETAARMLADYGKAALREVRKRVACSAAEREAYWKAVARKVEEVRR